jgi:hypothetical protein
VTIRAIGRASELLGLGWRTGITLDKTQHLRSSDLRNPLTPCQFCVHAHSMTKRHRLPRRCFLRNRPKLATLKSVSWVQLIFFPHFNWHKIAGVVTNLCVADDGEAVTRGESSAYNIIRIDKIGWYSTIG